MAGATHRVAELLEDLKPTPDPELKEGTADLGLQEIKGNVGATMLKVDFCQHSNLLLIRGPRRGGRVV